MSDATPTPTSEAVRQAEAAVATAAAHIADLGARLLQARSTGPVSGTGTATATLANERAAAVFAATAAQQALDVLRAQALRDEAHSPAETAIARVAPDSPILLLPVRLETRFQYQDAAGTWSFPPPAQIIATQLLIRIFPDDIHADGFEPALTAGEQELGVAYWTAVWRLAAAQQPERLEAWKRLLLHATPQRAAWIVTTLTPTNSQHHPRPRQPTFPTVAMRPGAWTRPAYARCLPDAWQAVATCALVDNGFSRTVTATSAMVRRPLAIGPDPGATGASPTPDQLDVDPGITWLVDFQAALSAGMAMVMTIPGQLQGPLTDLIVVGVCGTLDGQVSAQALAALFDAHHYHDGLALVAQGTPTKGTTTARSGYQARSTVATPATSLAIELGAPLDAQATSDGAVLAKALGLDATVFAHIEGADGSEQADAQAMVTALWPATWGYYLRQLLAGQYTSQQIGAWRQFTIDNVRGRGVIPAFRVGAQPYGILPVGGGPSQPPHDQGTPFSPMQQVLSQLMPVWQRAYDQVATVQSAGDPEATLVQLLKLDGVAQRFSVRGLLGAHVLALLQSQGAHAHAIAQAEQWAAATLDFLGSPVPIGQALFLPDSADISAPLVVGSGPTGAPGTYLLWLARAGWQSLRSESYAHGRPPLTLLYQVVREAVLQAYDVAAIDILQAQHPALPAATWLEPQVVDSTLPNPRFATIWTRLAQPMPGHSNHSIGSWLDQPNPQALGAQGELYALKQAILRLTAVSSDQLSLLLAETLGLTSHRLDAWAGSTATASLRALRTSSAVGIAFGGVGWIDQLLPAASLAAVTTAPAGEGGAPLFSDRLNAGYIHAPSLAQAETAAVLRAAQLSHGQAGQAFSVDLSSSRVRAGLALMEGIRNGQPLGALLGYTCEQNLHAANLDRLIAPLRAAFPLTANQLIPSTLPVEAVAANTVVDGLALVRAAPGLAWGTIGIIDPADQQAVRAQVAILQSALAAGGDLVTAEGVYQAVRGNPQRTTAIQDGIAGLDTLPPLPEVIRSMRSGIGMTHRLLALWNPTTAPGAWAAIAQSRPRALAEPALDAWAASLLGAPDHWRFRIHYRDANQNVIQTLTVSVVDLGLAAIDLLHLDLPQDQAQAGELEMRAYTVAEQRRTSATASATVALDFTGDPIWGPDMLALCDGMELVRTLRSLIGSARPISSPDLGAPGANASDADYDIAELSARLAAATAGLASAGQALQAALLSQDPGQLRTALMGAADYGIAGAAPLIVAGSDALTIATLVTQATSVSTEVSRRSTAVSGTSPSTVAAMVTGLQGIFGKDLVVCPRLIVSARTAALATGLQSTSALTLGAPSGVRGWLARSAQVRPGAARLTALLAEREVVALAQGATPSALQVAQFPLIANDRWIGLPSAPGTTVAGGRTGLVVHALSAIDPTQPLVGLAIDDWVETVPNQAETTALSFHFSAPSACAPQALLLALPKTMQSAWTLDGLIQNIQQARNLAKMRSVGPDLLTALGQPLPVAVVPYNTANDTASCPLWQLTP